METNRKPTIWQGLVLLLSVVLALASPTMAWADEELSGEGAIPVELQLDGQPDDTDPAPDDQTAEDGEPATSEVGEPSDTELQNLAPQSEGFSYVHDPRDNPKAMADIVEDDTTVYGFRPSPEGGLKQYAGFDWSDPAVVEAGRQDRIAYHESIASMYEMLESMVADGASTEEIARAVSTKRNEIRLASYADDPEGLAAVKARNLERYGNENGGTPDFFYEQYGSWETVIDKSFSTNSGMDACLGLYDDYYDLYVLIGQVEDDGKGKNEPDETGTTDDTDETGDPAEPVEPDSTEDDDTDDSPITLPDEQQEPATEDRPTAATGTSPARPQTKPTTAKLPATGDATGELPLLVGGIALVALGSCLRRKEASRAA